MVMNLRPSMTKRSILVLKLKEKNRSFEEGQEGKVVKVREKREEL